MPKLKFEFLGAEKIDAYPTAVAPGHGQVRIVRDLDCPNCGWPELGQTINLSGTGTVLLYCRKCEHGCEAELEPTKEKK